MSSSESAPPGERVFDDIYERAQWGRNRKGLGTSGSGSTLNATLLYRVFLQCLLKANAIRSVVDAGCGDWEFSQTVDWSGIDYKGYDVVERVIVQNTQRFAAANIQFFHGSVVELDLPAADLIICKHVLQHLPTRDVQQVLAKLKKYKHILLTNGVDHQTLSAPNVDIVVGGYRPLDPTRPPFNLPGVKMLTYWDGTYMQQVVYSRGENVG